MKSKRPKSLCQEQQYLNTSEDPAFEGGGGNGDCEEEADVTYLVFPQQFESPQFQANT